MRAARYLLLFLVYMLLIPIASMADIMNRVPFKRRKRDTGYLKVNKFMNVDRVWLYLLPLVCCLVLVGSRTVEGAEVVTGIDVGMDIVGDPVRPGLVELLVTMSADHGVGVVDVHISSGEGIVIEGDTLLQFDLAGGTKHSFPVRASIAEDVTANIGITACELESTSMPLLGMARRCFVTTTDGLEILDYGCGSYRKDERIRYEKPDPGSGAFEAVLLRKRQPEEPGQVTLRIVAWAEHGYCDEVNVSLLPGKGLEVHGEPSWTNTSDKDWNNPREVGFSVPPNDTVSTALTISGKDSSATISVYFIQTADSLECWGGEPGTYGRPLRYHPYKEKIPEPEGITGRLPDSTIARIKLERAAARKQKAMERMAELEKTPCTKPRQWIPIGDELWERFEGEYKFHRVERPE